MNRKIQLFLICIFFWTVFICNIQMLQANEGSPPDPAGAAAQVNQGVAPGKENAVAMDPNARAVIPSDSFDFGSAYEGNDIYHDFIIKNEGTAELKIISVKSGWGCATVSFDRVIPPGEEGKIKVKVVTKGYGGNKYNKSIRVDTNDPNHAKIELKISGDIKTFATIIPKSVYINGKVGENLSQVVKIVPETPELFKILKISAITDTDIQYSLQEIDNSGNKFYELTIENTKKTPGRYFDTISIITDKSDQTPLTIYVRGNIKPDADNQPSGSEKMEPPAPPEETAPGAGAKSE